MSNKDLLAEAEEAVTRLFSDTSVGRGITRENLEQIGSLVDDYLAALDDDAR